MFSLVGVFFLFFLSEVFFLDKEILVFMREKGFDSKILNIEYHLERNYLMELKKEKVS